MGKKIYIAGRVTGLLRKEALRNFERGKLLLFKSGYEGISPLDHVPECSTPKEAMRILIPILMECDGILLLNDSKFSPGAYLEEEIARYIGLLLFYEDDLN